MNQNLVWFLSTIIILSEVMVLSFRDGEWMMHHISSPACNNCATRVNWLCDKEFGSPPVPIENSHDQCIRFYPKQQQTSADEMLKLLGDNAVMTFVGDSNTRKMFLAALDYFGHSSWFEKLTKDAEGWREVNTRKTVDHTCNHSLVCVSVISFDYFLHCQISALDHWDPQT